MRRGTTPTYIMSVTGIDFDDVETWYVTFKQNKVEITKTGDDVMVYKDKYLIVSFTEEETMMFRPTQIDVQIRIKTKIDTLIATPIRRIDADRLLNNEVI